MGGSDSESAATVGKTGAEFVALSRAVFDAPDPAAAVTHINMLLDEHKPVFEETG
jgi:thiamine-phosphate pyrophosphorylase